MVSLWEITPGISGLVREIKMLFHGSRPPSAHTLWLLAALIGMFAQLVSLQSVSGAVKALSLLPSCSALDWEREGERERERQRERDRERDSYSLEIGREGKGKGDRGMIENRGQCQTE